MMTDDASVLTKGGNKRARYTGLNCAFVTDIEISRSFCQHHWKKRFLSVTQ